MSALTVATGVSLHEDLVASLFRFLKISLFSLAALVGLWLVSAMLSPGNDATSKVAPVSGSAGAPTRTAAIALVVAGKQLPSRRARTHTRSTASAGQQSRTSTTRGRAMRQANMSVRGNRQQARPAAPRQPKRITVDTGRARRSFYVMGAYTAKPTRNGSAVVRCKRVCAIGDGRRGPIVAGARGTKLIITPGGRAIAATRGGIADAPDAHVVTARGVNATLSLDRAARQGRSNARINGRIDGYGAADVFGPGRHPAQARSHSLDVGGGARFSRDSKGNLVSTAYDGQVTVDGLITYETRPSEIITVRNLRVTDVRRLIWS